MITENLFKGCQQIAACAQKHSTHFKDRLFKPNLVPNFSGFQIIFKYLAWMTHPLMGDPRHKILLGYLQLDIPQVFEADDFFTTGIAAMPDGKTWETYGRHK